MTEIAAATVRSVWPQPSGRCVVIAQRRGEFGDLKLWTFDRWLASLCERYGDPAGRPTVTLTWDRETRELKGIALPVEPVTAQVNA